MTTMRLGMRLPARPVTGRPAAITGSAGGLGGWGALGTLFGILLLTGSSPSSYAVPLFSNWGLSGRAVGAVFLLSGLAAAGAALELLRARESARRAGLALSGLWSAVWAVALVVEGVRTDAGLLLMSALLLAGSLATGYPLLGTAAARYVAGQPTLGHGGVRDSLSHSWSALPGRARWAVYGLALAGAVLLPSDSLKPLMSPGADWRGELFFPIGVYILLALGLNIVVGFAGLLDLGYVAFFAIGAYSQAILGTRYHLDFWEVLPIAIGLSMLSGLLLGAPTLRLRGDYLAIVTLGFGEIVRRTALNTDYIGGPRGVSGIPHPPSVSGVWWLSYGVLDSRPYYYLVLGLIVLAVIVAQRLQHSRVGRSWAAIREDEDAAELMGVPTLKFKLWSFSLGAAIGGSGGAMFAANYNSITPDIFPFTVSAIILAAVVLGGSGSIPGVIVGAFLVSWLPDRLRITVGGDQQFMQEHRMLFFGALLIAFTIFRPGGIIPSSRRRAELRRGESSATGELGAELPAGPAPEVTA